MSEFQKISEYLKANINHHISTIGFDGKPRNRPFMFAGVFENKFWYCTAIGKDVYQQLVANPFTQISVSSADFKWVRMLGKVRFSNEESLKKQIYDANPILHNLYKGHLDEKFTIFTLDDYDVEFNSFSEPPLKAHFD